MKHHSIYLLTLPAFAIAISGCVSLPVSPPGANSWQDQCYTGFAQAVSSIAGDSAIDCGFLSSGVSKGERSATAACAKDAAASDRPFKFGYAGFGTDSFFCDVAIRNADGQLISFAYDSDVTGQWNSSDGNAAVWTSRCDRIVFEPGSIVPGSFFDLRECTEAPEIFEGVQDQDEDGLG